MLSYFGIAVECVSTLINSRRRLTCGAGAWAW